MSLGLLLTLKEAAKLSASSSRPGLAEGGGLPTMELPGEWPDRPGGDLTQSTVRNIVRRLSLSLCLTWQWPVEVTSGPQVGGLAQVLEV